MTERASHLNVTRVENTCKKVPSMLAERATSFAGMCLEPPNLTPSEKSLIINFFFF